MKTICKHKNIKIVDYSDTERNVDIVECFDCGKNINTFCDKDSVDKITQQYGVDYFLDENGKLVKIK